MKFKKCMYLFISSLLLSSLCLNSVKAEEVNSDDLQAQIDNAINEYYDEVSAKSSMDLTKEQSGILAKRIETIKQNNNELDAYINSNSSIEARGVVDQGYIFLTLDSNFGSFYHGHAGIGTGTSGAIIEANPGVGVKLYSDRINGYWSSKDASVMGVVGGGYSTAANWANAQLGKPYIISPGYREDAYYCSSLVQASYMKAGISIIGSLGGYFLPLDLYNSSKTYTLRTYNNGFVTIQG